MFQSLTEKLANAFKRFRNKGKLTEADVREGMREVKRALLEADVNFKVVRDFISEVTERAVGSEVLESLLPAQQIVKIVNEELIKLMGSETAKLEISPKPPTVVMMAGLQGAGKTTHAAKIAKLMKSKGKNPLLVACDIYRPAAIDQLKIVGEAAGIPVFSLGNKVSPVEIAKAGVEHAKKNGFDMVFLDTAGRLHIDDELMEELEKIRDQVADKRQKSDKHQVEHRERDIPVHHCIKRGLADSVKREEILCNDGSIEQADKGGAQNGNQRNHGVAERM